MNKSLIQIFVLSSIISVISCLSFASDNQRTLMIVSADWCKFCKVAQKDMEENPTLNNLIKKYEIIDIDFDIDKDLIKGYNIKTIPTFIIFQDGKEYSRQTGYKGPKEFIKFLSN